MTSSTSDSFDPQEVSGRLLAWYGKEGRDLPWRQTRDPYAIWLSEIMLQQTTVAAVIPYYQRFLDAFPTVQHLSEASLDQVLELWAGLGYYSRARNLHRAARQVATELGGLFPDRLDGLMALPGVGRSTAGAILSIAFDEPAPILDGNVRRVLVRLFAWQEDPRSSRAEKQLWSWAEQLTPTEHSHDYAQAIMDLGATVCTPREPDCRRCPLDGICQASAEGLAEQLPIKRKRAMVPTRRHVALILSRKEALLVRQRPVDGLLGGMWEFPTRELVQGETPRSAASLLAKELGGSSPLAELGMIKHVYSHFKLELTLYVLDIDTAGVRADPPGRWCRERDLETLPLHGAHRKAYERFKTAARALPES